MVFRIDLRIFAFLILFYFTKQIKIYSVIMIFALIHEFSHLFAGILLKMTVKKITLMPLGLSIEFNLTQKDYNKKILKANILEIKRIIVAIAGPIANILIIIITSYLDLENTLKLTIIYSNFLITIFNLLPIYPLDGGRILKAIISLIANKKNANIYINKISNFTLFIITFLFSILIYYLKNIELIFILTYLWYMVLRENKKYRLKRILYEELQLSKKSY